MRTGPCRLIHWVSPKLQKGLWGTQSPPPLLCKNYPQESPSVYHDSWPLKPMEWSCLDGVSLGSVSPSGLLLALPCHLHWQACRERSVLKAHETKGHEPPGSLKPSVKQSCRLIPALCLLLPWLGTLPGLHQQGQAVFILPAGKEGSNQSPCGSHPGRADTEQRVLTELWAVALR